MASCPWVALILENFYLEVGTAQQVEETCCSKGPSTRMSQEDSKWVISPTYKWGILVL